ncbi:polysaccharide deacetylase family protein [Aurantiacibacter sediminis]|uniref:Polysaccharide deacetylase family protein n=1 Tax=Aurantiacibacter sediminis TaxID=2793064 RepID=A0ABS0N584_9SPHN|nr:polysaccharide deacetylase family protein [Aurantiacibacter sediminis]MBH5322952.1 polysaccharide deacetylase family protein [Aurantiacibacter sediminis]
MRSLLDQPPEDSRARFRDRIPRFILTVDTEEEFDWEKPLTRETHGTDHVRRLSKFQEFCEHQKVVPVYLVDWPIANSRLAAEILREPLAAGRAEIGVQLHPWVNPPFAEDVTQHNSFAGNLPRDLEEAKFVKLRDCIEAKFGVTPLIYRAGRYGVGENTARILAEHGIAIDTSARPQFDYSSVGGPNFRTFPIAPYWLDDERTLLELPLTTTFWGMLRKQGEYIYPRLWRAPSMRGVLSRLNMLERVPLTPEGVTVEEAIRGIDMALDEGAPMLVFSFHSPSLRPGDTPYVRTEEDLDDLYDWWRRVFAYLKQRGVKPSCVKDVMHSVER